jgi:hypothetical protein
MPVLEAASSPHLEQALKDGRGQIESVVLPHQYRHLSLSWLLSRIDERRGPRMGRWPHLGLGSTPPPRRPWPHQSSRQAFTPQCWRAKRFHNEHLRRRLCIGWRGGLCRAWVRAGQRPPSETGLSSFMSPAHAGAGWCLELARDVRANMPRILMWITLSIRWSFRGAHASCSCD